MLGCLPPGVVARVEPLPRELVMEPLMIDQAWRVESEKGQWVVHLECQSHYKHDVPERFCWYAAALGAIHRLPVEPVLILLAERHAPPEIPTRHEVRLGSLAISVEFRVAKLWEINAESVIATGQVDLMPWVTLMRASRADLSQALDVLRSAGDRHGIGHARMLAGLRYTKGSPDLLWLLERSRVMALITEEILKDSSYYQMMVEAVEQRALEQGLEQGSEQALRRTIRRLTVHRFPALGDLPEIERSPSRRGWSSSSTRFSSPLTKRKPARPS
ncbi:MAG: hypothetical protein ACRD44_05310 [Bryobacteraceae bacterium]